jgi:prepilin-type processing-associated H-X9-DG protein
MYKIIGTDQKEYGPVTAEQINQWIVQGRVNAQTKTLSDLGEWKPLGEYPEFAAAFGNRSARPPSVPPGLPPQSPQPMKTSGMAITSLVLGVLGFFTCGVTALIGLILGIVAMSRVKKSNGALSGHGIALAGTIVSGVFLFLLPVLAAMLLPALAKAKEHAQTIQCMNNMRQLAVHVRIYSAGHTNHFPPAATWCDALKPEVPDKTFRCPAGDINDRCDYAFNSNLDGLDAKDVNPNTVLFFESENGWNLNGGPELVLSQPRHQRMFGVAFADGHVEELTAARLAELRWNP